MTLLERPRVAALAARAMQRATGVAGRRAVSAAHERFPDLPRTTFELTIPTSVAPARAVVYLPAATANSSRVHVNFHGGGYVLRLMEGDDPLCRFFAGAGVTVINVDYVVAPQHRFPAAPHQAYEVVRWVAAHGAEYGWDGSLLTVGGQSAGGRVPPGLRPGRPPDCPPGAPLSAPGPRDQRR